MKGILGKKFKKIFLGFLVLFTILFMFRFIYGYTVISHNFNYNQAQFNSDISSLKKNYATNKYQVQSETLNQVIDQKYEKIADVKTKSFDFEREEKQSKEIIQKYEGLIQFEQKKGDTGTRVLNLVIGVPPQNFDSLYEELISIGNIQVKQITKKDKTNEYRELTAKKDSLVKIRKSLFELKSKNGKISEYVELENRILEIEQDLQGIGVSLGDFDDENEFCTVKYSLLEDKEIKIGIMQRIKDSLEWTIPIYLLLIIALFLLSLLIYLLLIIIGKFKIIEKSIKKS